MLKLAIDARELAKNPKNSLGIILDGLLRNLENEVELILFSDNEVQELYNYNIKKFFVFKKKASNSFSVLLYHKWIAETVSSVKPDVFFQINHFVPFKIDNKVKVITEIHDLFPLEYRNIVKLSSKIKFLYGIKKTLQNSTAIIVPSNFTKNRLTSYFQKIPKIFVIPSPYNKPCKPSEPHDLKKDEKYIFFLGRLSYWKGTDILIDAAKELEGDIDKIVLVGSIDDKKIFHKLIREMTPNLLYLGHITNEEREYLYRNAELFVYPARYDGYGIPPVDAVLRNCPILVSNIPVMKEKFMDKDVYFELEGGAKNLADKIRLILNRGRKKNLEVVEEIKFKLLEYDTEYYAKKLLEIVYSLNLL